MLSTSSKQKGTRFETDSVRFFEAEGLEARRLVEGGVLDEGDVLCGDWAIECKNRKRILLAKWFDKIAEKAERKGRRHALLVHRDGCGVKNFGMNYVTIEAAEFARLLRIEKENR